MAPPKGGKKEDEKAKGGSGGLIIALAVLTAVAGGGGFLFATQFLPAQMAAQTAAPAANEGHDAHGAPASGHGKPADAPKPQVGDLIALPPIFANLANPPNSYVRLEGSILVEPGYADGKLLAAKVSEDVIALLKTMQLSQLNGAAGMYHLREDINDRVKIRSEGKASELIISTLVIE